MCLIGQVEGVVENRTLVMAIEELFGICSWGGGGGRGGGRVFVVCRFLTYLVIWSLYNLQCLFYGQKRLHHDILSILHKSTAGRYRPVRVADGPITARCRFM